MLCAQWGPPQTVCLEQTLRGSKMRFLWGTRPQKVTIWIVSARSSSSLPVLLPHFWLGRSSSSKAAGGGLLSLFCSAWWRRAFPRSSNARARKGEQPGRIIIIIDFYNNNNNNLMWYTKICRPKSLYQAIFESLYITPWTLLQYLIITSSTVY